MKQGNISDGRVGKLGHQIATSAFNFCFIKVRFFDVAVVHVEYFETFPFQIEIFSNFVRIQRYFPAKVRTQSGEVTSCEPCKITVIRRKMHLCLRDHRILVQWTLSRLTSLVTRYRRCLKTV
jgi:hypothetical protein